MVKLVVWGMVWIPEIPGFMKGLLLTGAPRIPDHRDPNHQLTIDWILEGDSLKLF